MRRTGLIAALSLLTMAQSGSGVMRDFTLENDTRWTITAIYTSVPGAAWNRIHGGSVSSGQSTDVSFYNVGPCRMQIRIVFSNGDDASWSRGFDFCDLSRITVSFDGQNYTANSE